jgi:hypothetical protein
MMRDFKFLKKILATHAIVRDYKTKEKIFGMGVSGVIKSVAKDVKEF